MFSLMNFAEPELSRNSKAVRASGLRSYHCLYLNSSSMSLSEVRKFCSFPVGERLSYSY
jgi:hypothetical protein